MSCWQPDVACEWHPELTADELAVKIAEYRKKGWRPHIVSVHSNREEVKFLAVFMENKTNATWEFTPNLSVADYETQLIERKRCVFDAMGHERKWLKGSQKATQEWLYCTRLAAAVEGLRRLFMRHLSSGPQGTQ